MAAAERTVDDIQWQQSQTPKIIVDPELRDLIPPLTSEELDLLEESLLAEGCRDSLKVWNNDGAYVLMDGHHRYTFCLKYNILFKIDIVDRVHDRTDAEIWIYRTQAGRRNISKFLRAEYALKAKSLIAEKAKANQGTRTDILPNSAESCLKPIDTRAELEKISGVGHDSIAKTETILAKGSDLLKKEARAGTISINQAAEIAKRPLIKQDRLVKIHNERGIKALAANLKADEKDERRAARRAEFETAAKPETDKIQTWARLLDGEPDDIIRLEKLTDGNDDLNVVAHTSDVWNYVKSHPLFGIHGYPGQIPGQIVLQTLNVYTKRGNLVVDPMCGGGTTLDACLVMGRRCLAFDSEPSACAARPEIIQKDALAAIRELSEKPDLVWLDPPYYKKMDKEYGENSISRLNRDEYLKFFDDLAKACYDAHAERVALLMMDYIDMTGHTDEDGVFIYEHIENNIHNHEYVNRFIAAGFLVERTISCNLSDVIGGDIANKYKKSKRLALQARNLTVFKRKADGLER